MSLRSDRVLLADAGEKLRAKARELGFESAFDMGRRCKECKVGRPNSLHKEGRAFDLLLYDDLDGDGLDDDYVRDTEAHRPLGEYWESLHPRFRWGGAWDDGNHYEIVPGDET